MKAKGIHNNGILNAVKLDCNADEVALLSAFLQGIAAAERFPAKFQLETYVLIDLYDRNYKIFSIVKPRKLKLRAAEFVALERLLMRFPCPDDYAAIVRNGIVAGLSSIAWQGRTTVQSYLQESGI